MTPARTFIAVMQVTVDGFILGPDGESDWVDSWSDGLGVLPPVDAFVLGGGMFPDYEVFWSAALNDPTSVSEWIGRDLYERELQYARLAAETPHLVLSTTLESVSWPTARLIRDLDELRGFKAQGGNPAYIVGGPGLLANLINAGLLDELRLIVHPVAVGTGRPMFGDALERRELELLPAGPLAAGRILLTYRFGSR